MPDLNQVEVNLVQGRWHENFMPILDSYKSDPLRRHKEITDEAGIPRTREPGFSMKSDVKTGSGSLSHDQIEKLYGHISTILNVAIFEQRT